MKILFHKNFYDSTYANDNAALPGRMEAAMEQIQSDRTFEVIEPAAAGTESIVRAHGRTYVETLRENVPLYDMAALAAGGAIEAAASAVAGEPAFACVRPPGHHAYRDSAWGYCALNNMGIALLQLRHEGKIKSAFLLDFDAHTGDGTQDVLSGWSECIILNPYAHDNEAYYREIQDCIKNIQAVDIVGVCAGFDSYEKDVGRKLATFDFYRIGVLMKQFSERASHGRRFGVLEGGYYLPDLGKNVLAFCQGFQ